MLEDAGGLSTRPMERAHWNDVDYWKEMSEKTWSTMDSAMGAVKVTEGLNVLMTIDNRSYHMTSPGGRMSIKPVSSAEVNKLMPKIQGRIVFSHDAFKEEMQQFPNNMGNMANMMDKRKVQMDGDLSLFAQIQREMDGHIGSVQAQMREVGAHSEDVKEATLYHIDRLEAEKAEREEVNYYNNSDYYDLAMWGFSSEAQMPLLQKMSSWILFSAGSTMMGNVGQANYCAANACLDAMTFSMKDCGPFDWNPMTLMWGAVAGLGMRWKAFASADFLLTADNSAEIMMDYTEASMVLKMLVAGVSPEWVMGSKMDEQSRYYMFLPHPALEGKERKDPWGFSKGKGGGELFEEPPWAEDAGPLTTGEATPEPTRIQLRAASRERQKRQQLQTKGTRIRPRNATKNAWLFEGRRVQIYGLERSPHMNNAKGTLIAEVEEGKWQVKLDGDDSDKLVRIQNLMTLTGKPLTEYAGGAEIGDQEPSRPLEQYCIAGTWDEWLPCDMDWDASQLCFFLEIDVRANIETSFAICRGKAGEKKWKTRGQNNWTIAKERLRTRYQIRLFINAGGSVKKVDWVKMPHTAVVSS